MSAAPKGEQCGEAYPFGTWPCMRVRGHTGQHMAWKPNGDLAAEWVLEKPLVTTSANGAAK